MRYTIVLICDEATQKKLENLTNSGEIISPTCGVTTIKRDFIDYYVSKYFSITPLQKEVLLSGTKRLIKELKKNDEDFYFEERVSKVQYEERTISMHVFAKGLTYAIESYSEYLS